MSDLKEKTVEEVKDSICPFAEEKKTDAMCPFGRDYVPIAIKSHRYLINSYVVLSALFLGIAVFMSRQYVETNRMSAVHEGALVRMTDLEGKVELLDGVMVEGEESGKSVLVRITHLEGRVQLLEQKGE